jgi:hypothetical protein
VASESSDPLVAWLEVLIKLAEQPYLYLQYQVHAPHERPAPSPWESHSTCISPSLLNCSHGTYHDGTYIPTVHRVCATNVFDGRAWYLRCPKTSIGLTSFCSSALICGVHGYTVSCGAIHVVASSLVFGRTTCPAFDDPRSTNTIRYAALSVRQDRISYSLAGLDLPLAERAFLR